MSKNKKITASKILKAIGQQDAEQLSITYGTDETMVAVPVKASLSLLERVSMIEEICDMVFITGENGNAIYCPALKSFATAFAIVHYFTDVALPTDSSKAHEFLVATKLDVEIFRLLPTYIESILEEAHDAIEYRKQELLKKSKLDTILDEVIGVIQAVRVKTEDADLPSLIEYVKENAPGLQDDLTTIIGQQPNTTPTA